MKTNAPMPSDSNEILFLVAKKFIELNHMQKLNIGLKLKLIDFGGFCLTEKAVEEMVFKNAYKNNMIAKLVAEIGKMEYYGPQQS